MILVVYVAGALVTAGMFRAVGATRGEATMLAEPVRHIGHDRGTARRTNNRGLLDPQRLGFDLTGNEHRRGRRGRDVAIAGGRGHERDELHGQGREDARAGEKRTHLTVY